MYQPRTTWSLDLLCVQHQGINLTLRSHFPPLTDVSNILQLNCANSKCLIPSLYHMGITFQTEHQPLVQPPPPLSQSIPACAPPLSCEHPQNAYQSSPYWLVLFWKWGGGGLCRSEWAVFDLFRRVFMRWIRLNPCACLGVVIEQNWALVWEDTVLGLVEYITDEHWQNATINE